MALYTQKASEELLEECSFMLRKWPVQQTLSSSPQVEQGSTPSGSRSLARQTEIRSLDEHCLNFSHSCRHKV